VVDRCHEAGGHRSTVLGGRCGGYRSAAVSPVSPVCPVCLERIRSGSGGRLCFQEALGRLKVAQGIVAEARVLGVDVDQRLGDHGSGRASRELVD
jgi:hypothetical protein